MNLTMDSIEITRISSRGQVVIPLSMRSDLREGDKLIIIRRGDNIILKKPKIELDFSALANDSFAESWDSKEDEESFAYLQ